MTLLFQLTSILDGLKIPAETGVFQEQAPDTYVVMTPLSDTFEGFADNAPHYETQEVRLSLFCKENYIKRKNQMVKALLGAGIGITDRRYLGFEEDTQYHHYAIDVVSAFDLKEA